MVLNLKRVDGCCRAAVNVGRLLIFSKGNSIRKSNIFIKHIFYSDNNNNE
jgi:hypothetical protein